MPHVHSPRGASCSPVGQLALSGSPAAQRAPPPASVNEQSITLPSTSTEGSHTLHARIGSIASGARSPLTVPPVAAQARALAWPVPAAPPAYAPAARPARPARSPSHERSLRYLFGLLHLLFPKPHRSYLGTLMVRPGCRGAGKSDPERRLLLMQTHRRVKARWTQEVAAPGVQAAT